MKSWVIKKICHSLRSHCSWKSCFHMYLVFVCWVNSSRRLKMVSRAFLNSNSRTATLSSLWFPVQCESSEFLVKSKRDKSSQIWEPQIEDWIRFHLVFFDLRNEDFKVLQYDFFFLSLLLIEGFSLLKDEF